MIFKHSIVLRFVTTLFVLLLVGQGIGLALIKEPGVTWILYQGFISLIIAFVLMVFVNRNIKKPLSIINKALGEMEGGDLSTQVPDFGKNEIGSITRRIESLAEKLSITIQKFSLTTRDVSMAMKQLTITLKNIAEGIHKQLRSTEEMITTIKHTNDSCREIMNSIERLSAISGDNVTSLLELKAAAEEIASSTQRLFQATDDSYSMVVEISQTTKSITESTKETSSAVEDISASIEEVNASIREVEDNAKESARLASNTRAILGGQCIDAMTDAISGIEKILSEVRHSSEIVARLSNRSVDIEKILKVIKEVTEQTNLLSLNAAILAAQAGEYGKSFSVVADEMRALSDRTATSTKEIANIVKAIQSEISEAVRSIEASVSRVNEGNALVFKSAEYMANALESAQTSDAMASAIRKATEEQAEGVRHITSAMDNIVRMMERVRSAINEQSNSTSYLLESASNIKEVAEIAKHGTEDQMLGTADILKNLELAKERIGSINEFISKQEKVNEGIVIAITEIKDTGMTTIRDVEEVSLSMKTLNEEMDALKREMEKFKVKSKK
jgi:methyl-accepting chemotaxis protein